MLPAASTSFTADPTFVDIGGDAELRYEFEIDGEAVRSGLKFHRVRAYRFRAEGHCTPWHVDGAYDTLVEVAPSEWCAELAAPVSSGRTGEWNLRHFLIFLDGAGAFEVVAESWTWLPEQRVQH